MNKKVASRCLLGTEEADSLLGPVVNFLSSSGLTDAEIDESLQRVRIRRAGQDPGASIGKFEHIDSYRDVVSRWTTDPAYLDERGYPRPLSINGKFGFKGLLQSARCTATAAEAIRDLRRYGNVRRRRDGKIALLKNFLHVSSSTSVAFEPHFQFLNHASRTTSSLLRKKKVAGDLRNFWRVAEVVDLPKAHLEEFLEFSKTRSLSFLKELDEWLRAHSQPAKTAKKTRAGLGLFSFFEEV